MTGSYKRNLSGGVLRKNISRLADEIDVDTTGLHRPARCRRAGQSGTGGSRR